jgi:hypothetical protein
MCCWRRVEKICWTDLMRNGNIKGVKEERNTLHTRKTNWIGHILRRNCLLKHFIEGKIVARIEVKERRGRRRKKLLDDL